MKNSCIPKTPNGPIRFLGALLFFVCFAISFAGGQVVNHQAVLADGTVVTGAFLMKSISIRTSYAGELTFRATELQRVEFRPDEGDRIYIHVLDGSRLSGYPSSDFFQFKAQTLQEATLHRQSLATVSLNQEQPSVAADSQAVALRNGDIIHGRIRLNGEFTSVFGVLTISDMVSLSFVSTVERKANLVAKDGSQYKAAYDSDTITIVQNDRILDIHVGFIESVIFDFSYGPIGSQPIFFGQPINGEIVAGEEQTIGQERPGDVYAFSASEDDSIRISMKSDAFDTYLSLFQWGGSENYTLLDTNDDAVDTDSVIERQLTTGGVYVIVASPLSTGNFGEYELEVVLTAQSGSSF